MDLFSFSISFFKIDVLLKNDISTFIVKYIVYQYF